MHLLLQVKRPDLMSFVFHCSLSWLVAICRSGCLGYLSALQGNWLHSSSLSQEMHVSDVLLWRIPRPYLFTHKQVGLSGAVWERRFCIVIGFTKGARISRGQNRGRLGKVFAHVKGQRQMTIPSPHVQACLATSAGCHQVWFEKQDCNSKRQRWVFPKASQAICRSVYRSCACYIYMPSTTRTTRLELLECSYKSLGFYFVCRRLVINNQPMMDI